MPLGAVTRAGSAGLERTRPSGLQGFDCQRASVGIHELDLVAVTLVVDEDDGPHVAGDQAVCRQVLEQRDRIQLL